jgi:hypothetical protein
LARLSFARKMSTASTCPPTATSMSCRWGAEYPINVENLRSGVTGAHQYSGGPWENPMAQVRRQVSHNQTIDSHQFPCWTEKGLIFFYVCFSVTNKPRFYSPVQKTILYVVGPIVFFILVIILVRNERFVHLSSHLMLVTPCATDRAWWHFEW